MDPKGTKFQTWLICGAIVLCIVAVYFPVIRYDFIHYDDNTYVTNNRHVISGLTWPGIVWAFTARYASNWHPLTWLSHMVDCQLFGLNPGWHHSMNVAIHAANSLLLFLIFRRMTGATWPSALVAGLFALHPLHVESVAWVAERKDVLSTLFFLLTLWTYGRYATEKLKSGKQKAEIRSIEAPKYYLLTLAFFTLGLMSKPMLVTTPFVLLLLDFWPLHRFESTGNPFIRSKFSRTVPLFVEKIPFFVLAGICCGLTFWAQQNALFPTEELPVSHRLENSMISYCRYIGKMVWPGNLSVFYPQVGVWPWWQVGGAALILSAISVLAIRARFNCPYLIAGWLWFLGTLVPVIGLVQVGSQAMADRYTYIPLIGLFICFAWFVHEWKSQALQIFLPTTALVLFASLSSSQVRHWKNTETLAKHALNISVENAIAQNLFGCSLLDQGRIQEASTHFAEAVRLKPGYHEARLNLGITFVMQGQYQEAIDHYNSILESHPHIARAHFNLARALDLSGNHSEALVQYRETLSLEPENLEARIYMSQALVRGGLYLEGISQYNEALHLSPNNPDLHYSLAAVLETIGKDQEATEHYRLAARFNPQDLETQTRLGRLLARNGRIDEAVRNFLSVVKVKPSAQSHYDLALAYSIQGKVIEAIAEYRRALALNPDWAIALNDLAWLLATNPHSELRNGCEAVQLAERACQLSQRKEARFLGTLDAAYAEAGAFQEATRTAAETRALAESANQSDLAKAAEERLKFYQAGKAFHQPTSQSR